MLLALNKENLIQLGPIWSPMPMRGCLLPSSLGVAGGGGDIYPAQPDLTAFGLNVQHENPAGRLRIKFE